MKYISVGGANYDITLLLEEYPKENEKVKTNNRISCGGGCASTCAYLLSSWKENSYFAGTIGNDLEGNIVEEELKEKKVNLKYLNKQNGKTPVSYIVTNKLNGSRTVVTYNELENTYTYQEKHKIEKDFDCILLDGYNKSFADQVLYENKNAVTILDAGRVNIDVVDLAYKVDYVIASKSFAEKYTNINISDKDSLIKIYDTLYNKFNTNIVITLEDEGCFSKIEDDYMLIPSIKVSSIDTTSAGDIFHASFAYFITHNYTLFDCLRLSNITAALSTKYIGSRNSIVFLEEVLETYDELYK